MQVSGLTDVVAIAAGGYSLALKSDGTVWAWGYNGHGSCGDGLEGAARPSIRDTPVQVTNLSGVVAIAAGALHGLALKSDGTVWAWGLNDAGLLGAAGGGQLGDGTMTTRSTPVPVMGLGGVVAIAAGSGHSLALQDDDTLWAWGVNGFGQLGDGTTTARLTPVPVRGLVDVIAIAAGHWHSLALTRADANGTHAPQGYRRQYRPRTEGLFARIVHHQYTNNEYWEVRSKDGLVSYYGTPGMRQGPTSPWWPIRRAERKILRVEADANHRPLWEPHRIRVRARCRPRRAPPVGPAVSAAHSLRRLCRSGCNQIPGVSDISLRRSP